jgi:RNA recognition motif-containing protein
MSMVNFDVPPNENKQIFIGNLRFSISDELLKVKFGAYGKIKRIDRNEPGKEKVKKSF